MQRTSLGQVLPLQAPGWVRAHLLSPGPTLSLCWSPLYFTQLHHQTASPAPLPGPCGPCESRQLHLGPGPTGPEKKRQSPLPISRAGAERGERRCSAAEQADAQGKTHRGPVPSTSLSPCHPVSFKTGEWAPAGQAPPGQSLKCTLPSRPDSFNQKLKEGPATCVLANNLGDAKELKTHCTDITFFFKYIFNKCHVNISP